MKNTILFDASSSNVYTFGVIEGNKFFNVQSYERLKMSVQLPVDFGWLKDLSLNAGPLKAIIGKGPGSFTGIKSGLSFFLAFLYSLGVKKVETTSSSRVFLNLFEGDPDTFKIVAIPFNRGEYFISLYDNSGTALFEDVFTKAPFDNLIDKIQHLTRFDSEIIVPVECSDDIVLFLSRFSEIKGMFSDRFVFKEEMFDKMEDLQTVDISTEPMILNYVTHPANIEGSDNLYVKN